MEKDNKNIICGGGNVVAREEKAIRVLVSTVYWLSPAAIRLFPFLVREVPLEEIDGVRKEKERLTAAWFLVSHVNH